MFFLIKSTRLIQKNINFKNLLIPYCYFSAGNDGFVKKAKALEKFKTSDTFSPLAYENGKYILFLNSDMVCLELNEKLVFKNYKEIEDLKKYKFTTVFLDILTDSDSEKYLFAVNLHVETELEIELTEIEVNGKFVELRKCLYILNQKEAECIIHARGLLNFCITHKYCCYCGGSLQVKEGGYKKQCTNCKFIHYPKLTPVGITLVDDQKHEEVFLIRQKRNPPGMYTCVAGYIEPGESLEETVKREVAEEVGLNIFNVEYCVSQHWALPSSQLILGCIATCQDKNADTDVNEIQDSKWVKAEELKDAVLRVRQLKNLSDLTEMNEKKLWAPPRNAVSHYLMVTWLNKYHNFDSSATS